MKTINLILKSDSLHYPENNPSSFRTVFPQTISCENYQIALQSIAINLKHSPIPPEIANTKNHIILFLTPTDFKNNKPATYVTIPQNCIKPINLLKYLNRRLQIHCPTVVFGLIRTKIYLTISNCILLMSESLLHWFDLPVDNNISKYLGYGIITMSYTEKTIIANSNFNYKITTPKILRVILNEMQQSVSANGFHQELAIVHAKKMTKNYLFYVTKFKEYFNLQTANFNQLSIKITDENYKELNLVKDQPTIVFLKLKKMPKNSFILRLSSLDSQNIFTENSNSNFRIQLNQAIDKSCGPLEVALTSIMISNDIDYAKILENRSDFWIEININNQFSKLIFGRESFSSKANFINAFNNEIIDETGNDYIIMTEAPDDKISILFNKKCEVYFSKLAGLVFNKLPNDLIINNKGEIEEVFVMYPEENTLELFEKITFSKVSPRLLFLHCNFVSPTLVGESYGQILKIIPLEFENENITTLKYDVKNLDFFDVSMNDRSILEFKLCTVDNLLIPFKEESNEIFVTLLFREKTSNKYD